VHDLSLGCASPCGVGWETDIGAKSPVLGSEKVHALVRVVDVNFCHVRAGRLARTPFYLTT